MTALNHHNSVKCYHAIMLSCYHVSVRRDQIFFMLFWQDYLVIMTKLLSLIKQG
jgi:hypothetical protein